MEPRVGYYYGTFIHSFLGYTSFPKFREFIRNFLENLLRNKYKQANS